MKRKWETMSKYHKDTWRMALALVTVLILVLVILVAFGDPPEPQPSIVQHEIVLRVVVDAPPPEDEFDFCSPEDCWWKIPAFVFITLVGGLGSLVLILDKASRH